MEEKEERKWRYSCSHLSKAKRRQNLAPGGRCQKSAPNACCGWCSRSSMSWFSIRSTFCLCFFWRLLIELFRAKSKAVKGDEWKVSDTVDRFQTTDDVAMWHAIRLGSANWEDFSGLKRRERAGRGRRRSRRIKRRNKVSQWPAFCSEAAKMERGQHMTIRNWLSGHKFHS